jgi:hypothetical protein
MHASKERDVSSSPNPGPNPTEAFGRMWSDFMSQMGAAGFAPQPSMNQDAMKHAQRMFMDAWSRYLDDYMRSPQFLEMLKRTMDNAMSFKQQMDKFVAQSLKTSGVPSREDADYTIEVLHGMERRLNKRLDELSDRISAMESDDASGGASKSTAKTPRKAAR